VRHTRDIDLPTLQDGDLVLRPKTPDDAGARRRGVATRAVRLLAEWARRELGLTRIEILPHHDNAASRRVAQKAGFRDTGDLKPCPRAAHDEPVYAVFAWEAPEH
jgi:RimJ/RimL family protein N-acetyltransferase